MPVLGELFHRATTPEAYVSGYRERFASLVTAIDSDAVARVIERLEHVIERGGTIFVVGNGGSGAVAAHWVNDLGVNSLVDGQPGIRVVSLADNASAITAVGNDVHFEDVFAAQIRSYVRPEDALIVMSVSGNSPNLISALEHADAVGATTIAFTGMSGGKARDLAEIVVHTDSDVDEYGPVEDVFSMFMHIITGFIAMRRGRRLHH